MTERDEVIETSHKAVKNAVRIAENGPVGELLRQAVWAKEQAEAQLTEAREQLDLVLNVVKEIYELADTPGLLLPVHFVDAMRMRASTFVRARAILPDLSTSDTDG